MFQEALSSFLFKACSSVQQGKYIRVESLSAPLI